MSAPSAASADISPLFVDVIHEPIEPGDVTVYEGIPSATVERALIDCRDTIMPRATARSDQGGDAPRPASAGEQRVLEAIGGVA